MKEQNSGDQGAAEIARLKEELKNANDCLRATSAQLERVSQKINAAMPHFRSAMGSEADHAELAVGQLIVERDTLREACSEALRVMENLRKATGDAIPGGICWTLRTALASLYDNGATKDATRPPYHPHELGD